MSVRELLECLAADAVRWLEQGRADLRVCAGSAGMARSVRQVLDEGERDVTVVRAGAMIVHLLDNVHDWLRDGLLDDGVATDIRAYVRSITTVLDAPSGVSTSHRQERAA